MARRLRIGHPRQVRLSADAATYDLTGVTADFEKSTPQRSVDAEAGSYAMTGVAAGLNKTTASGAPYTLTAARGTFSNAGVSANLTLTQTASITAFNLTSAVGGSLLPFSVGHAFKKADVPAGYYVSADIADFHAAILNYWPDGSVKFAVLSGRKTLSAGVSTAVVIGRTLTAPVGSNVETSNLQATNATAAISFGGVSVSWSGTDWLSPFRQITAGKQMSSWHYRKAIGADTHLVAWLEVRCYANGAVEVLPWIENGYLNVASPGSKSGRATFTLGGTLRYDSINDANLTSAYAVTVVSAGVITMPHHSRMALVSGGKFSHWLGTDPQITPKHDRTYFAATKVVPTYHPSTINNAALAALTEVYSPMRPSYVTQGMGGTGYAEDIGLLPMHAAMYLVSGDVRAYRAMMSQGFGLGGYCIHYRDETTNRPLLLASYPGLSINSGSSAPPTTSGSNPYLYAPSHHPASAYAPYLASGWGYFAEEMQFQTTLHYLSMSTSRQGANMYFTPSMGGAGINNQGGPRAQGWVWRTCAMTASCTPDADSLRAQFVTVLEYNANRFRVEHETGAVGNSWAPNNLGLIAEPGYGGTTIGQQVITAPWQDDFITMSVGLCWDLEVITTPSRITDLQWFRDFKYKAPVGRLGNQNVAAEWNFRRAAQYNIPNGTRSGANTMAWYATWGDAYTAYFGAPNTGNTGTDLIDGNIASTGMSTSYWGNLQPAIAYAVDHGATGAVAAYSRMVNASNYSAKADEWKDIPIWGIKPRSAAGGASTPAWLSGRAIGEWFQISGTNLSSVPPNPVPPGITGPQSKIVSWNGAALKRSGSTYLIGACGGHGDYGGNEVNAITLGVDTPVWVQLRASSLASAMVNGAPVYYDGRRSSTHTYYTQQFINQDNRLMVAPAPGMLAGFLPNDSAWETTYPERQIVTSFSLDTNDWDGSTVLATGQGYYPKLPATVSGDFTACLCVSNPLTGDVYYAREYQGLLWKYTRATNTWSSFSYGHRNYAGSAYDFTRDRILQIGSYGGDLPPRVISNTGATVSATFTGLGASALTFGGYPCVIYDEYNDRFLVFRNTSPTITGYAVNASTWAVTALSVTGTAPPFRDNGLHNSIQYVPELRCIVGAFTYNGNMYAMRVA